MDSSLHIIIGFFVLIAIASISGCTLPPEILHKVPHVCQAPTGNWDDPRHQDGCEEACILMMANTVQGIQDMDPEAANNEIQEMCVIEEGRFGSYIDTGLEDTTTLLHAFFESKNIHCPATKYVKGGAVTVQGMKEDLAQGYVLLFPINAQKGLMHPNYRSMPLVHMVLVVGYRGDACIINDPGTVHGTEMDDFSCEDLLFKNGDYISGEGQNNEGDTREKAYMAVKL